MAKVQKKAAAEHRLVTVIELINLTRGEIFVAITDELVPQFIRRARVDPSTTMDHWAKTDSLDHRTVEYAMPLRDARRFVEGYVTAISRSNWKVTAHELQKPLLRAIRTATRRARTVKR